MIHGQLLILIPSLGESDKYLISGVLGYMISITTVARENHAVAYLTDIHPHRKLPWTASGMNIKMEGYLFRVKAERGAHDLKCNGTGKLCSCRT